MRPVELPVEVWERVLAETDSRTMGRAACACSCLREASARVLPGHRERVHERVRDLWQRCLVGATVKHWAESFSQRLRFFWEYFPEAGELVWNRQCTRLGNVEVDVPNQWSTMSVDIDGYEFWIKLGYSVDLLAGKNGDQSPSDHRYSLSSLSVSDDVARYSCPSGRYRGSDSDSESEDEAIVRPSDETFRCAADPSLGDAHVDALLEVLKYERAVKKDDSGLPVWYLRESFARAHAECREILSRCNRCGASLNGFDHAEDSVPRFICFACSEADEDSDDS